MIADLLKTAVLTIRQWIDNEVVTCKVNFGREWSELKKDADMKQGKGAKKSVALFFVV